MAWCLYRGTYGCRSENRQGAVARAVQDSADCLKLRERPVGRSRSFYSFAEPESVGALGLDEFAVETSDIAEWNALGTFGCACACVGTVAEAEFVHFGNHSACATLAFYLALRQECELAYLG